MRKLFFDILILSIVAFGLLWLLDPANAQECPDGKCPEGNPAVVRVYVKEGPGPRAVGSGTIFRQERKVAYVLTAAHVIRDRVKNGVTVWTGKQLYQATVLRDDRLWDVAILRIANPGITPVQLGDKVPVRGDSVECSGLGPDGTYRYFQGSVTQFVSPGEKYPFEWMEVRAVVRQGDSGGPIVNKKGRIVGLITGSDRAITVGPCLPRIRKIVDGLLGRRPVIGLPPAQITPERPLVPPLAAINYDLLAAAVLKQINSDDFRGPAGPIGPIGLPGSEGANGESGAAGSRGPSGKFSDLTKDEKKEIAEMIKELINGSVRVKVQAVSQK